jgi:hypothetical protein
MIDIAVCKKCNFNFIVTDIQYSIEVSSKYCSCGVKLK